MRSSIDFVLNPQLYPSESNKVHRSAIKFFDNFLSVHNAKNFIAFCVLISTTVGVLSIVTGFAKLNTLSLTLFSHIHYRQQNTYISC